MFPFSPSSLRSPAMPAMPALPVAPAMPFARPNDSLSLLNPDGLYDPRPNGYSHVALVEGPVRIVYVSGQGGEDAAGCLPLDFPRQVARAMHNLRIALQAAGADVGDVAKLTVLVVDHSHDRLRTFGAALREMWGDRPTPACTLIPVPRLALDNMLFEIEATAVLPA
ncbi:putative Endoribonuclease L-PSP [Cupriavidus taiwanensis]|uniref:Putative Endoribonuclease L-PSP n=2 Tax=Cupriavidus taiwanensis TaxID=164546 RepID=A0A375JAM4_9BURK|nr:putative Endoribonuclease L-PSP [Cupriavidus taiwanensis]